MATTDRPSQPDADPAAAADQLRSAAFVQLVGVATGDGLAATAQLARALSARSIPFQVRVDPLGARHPPGGSDACTVSVGRPTVGARLDLDATASLSAAAFDIAGALHDADPEIALAGLTAAEMATIADRPDIVDAAGLERRPGLGLPTADVREGLAWTTLFHAPYSGDPDAVDDRLTGIDRGDADADRRLASLVAMTVAAAGGPPAAGAGLETALRPYEGGPVETIPGYADVLSALAVEAPGLGIRLAMDGSGREAALEAWQAHGRRVHAAVRSADRTARDDLLVATVDAGVPMAAVARLLRDFVADPPTVAVVGDDRVLVTSREAPDRLAAAVETATATVEDADPDRVSQAATHGRRARIDTPDPQGVTDAFAEAR